MKNCCPMIIIIILNVPLSGIPKSSLINFIDLLCHIGVTLSTRLLGGELLSHSNGVACPRRDLLAFAVVDPLAERDNKHRLMPGACLPYYYAETGPGGDT